MTFIGYSIGVTKENHRRSTQHLKYYQIMKTLPTDYSVQQLIDALKHEWEYLIHDDFEEGVDMTVEEYLAYLQTLTHAQLIEECACDDEYFTLNEFIEYHSN